jgi:hypothetical protein
MDSLRPDFLDELARIYARAAVDAFLAKKRHAGDERPPSAIERPTGGVGIERGCATRFQIDLRSRVVCSAPVAFVRIREHRKTRYY